MHPFLHSLDALDLLSDGLDASNNFTYPFFANAEGAGELVVEGGVVAVEQRQQLGDQFVEPTFVQLAIPHRIQYVLIGDVTRLTRHFQVHAGAYALDPVDDSVPVRDDDAFESPLVLELIGQQPG